jgi:hypothetical protein
MFVLSGKLGQRAFGLKKHLLRLAEALEKKSQSLVHKWLAGAPADCAHFVLFLVRLAWLG